jgi:hypothetical protein
MEKNNTPNYKAKFCDICQKDYKDYYQHKRVKHSEKEKTFELCFDCGKTFQKNYIKKHKCSEVIKKAKENWMVFCKECESFHMTNCIKKRTI